MPNRLEVEQVGGEVVRFVGGVVMTLTMSADDRQAGTGGSKR